MDRNFVLRFCPFDLPQFPFIRKTAFVSNYYQDSLIKTSIFKRQLSLPDINKKISKLFEMSEETEALIRTELIKNTININQR